MTESAVGFWRSLVRSPFASSLRIDDDAWAGLLENAALIARLDAPGLSRLRGLCEAFLARKSFSAAADHELEDFHCLAIAAQACLPVLGLGIDCLDGWREVIVYPAGFRVRGEVFDEDTGIVTEYEDALIGEAWDRGPLVLSWADIAEDLAHPFDGYNVVIHEIAHKLDMLDGAMNGTPLLPAHIDEARWRESLTVARAGIAERIKRGIASPIDPYAAESDEEFFAVVSEIHFSDPGLLQRQLPEFAELLGRYYAGAQR